MPLLFPGAESTFEQAFSFTADPPAPFVSPSNVAQVPINLTEKNFTTLHVSEWLQKPGFQRFYLIDHTTGEKKLLSKRFVNRHRDFNITDSLKTGHRYSLVFELREDGWRNAFLQELIVRTYPGIPFFPPIDIFCVGLFFSAVFYFRIKYSRPLFPFSQRETVCLLALVAFSLRWQYLGASFGHPLEGDANSYRDSALGISWHHLFQNGIREPFYIWSQRISMMIMGLDIWKFRMFTVLLSVSSIVVLYFLSMALSARRSVAVMACLLASLGQYPVFEAARGERSQLFTLLILLFCWALMRVSSRSWKGEVFLGVLGGLVCWTWLIGGIGVAVAYGFRWALQKISYRQTRWFWIVFGILVGVFLFQQWKYAGDPFQSVNAHVNFYKNAKETGVPSYSGEKSNWSQFLFSDQGATKVANDSFWGLLDLFLNPNNPFNKSFLGFHYSTNTSYLMFPFFIVGLIVSFYKKEYWIWVLVLSFLNISVSLMPEVRDPRLFYHILPFFCYFFGRGCVAIYDGIRIKVASRSSA